jgi:hypothetical protein
MSHPHQGKQKQISLTQKCRASLRSLNARERPEGSKWFHRSILRRSLKLFDPDSKSNFTISDLSNIEPSSAEFSCSQEPLMSHPHHGKEKKIPPTHKRRVSLRSHNARERLEVFRERCSGRYIDLSRSLEQLAPGERRMSFSARTKLEESSSESHTSDQKATAPQSKEQWYLCTNASLTEEERPVDRVMRMVFFDEEPVHRDGDSSKHLSLSLL